MPQSGEKTVVSVLLGDETINLTGSVVYTEPGMGFAVQFTDLSPEQISQINALIAAAASRSNAV